MVVDEISYSLSASAIPIEPSIRAKLLSKYEPGQVWTYKTRPGEESSRLTIVKVEPHDEIDVIVHIYISDVAIDCPSAPDGVVRNIHHSPYTEGAIDRSVKELESTTDKLPDFKEGYAVWKEGFDEGEAGVFDINVKEGVQVMADAVQGGA